MPGPWLRTCQECGHQQKDVEPDLGGMTEAYAYRKCRRCKSEALDYGSYQSEAKDENTE